MDETKLLNAIREEEIDFSKPVYQTQVFDIMSKASNGSMNFFIEGLTSYAGEGEMDLYLSYYDDNLDAIVLTDRLEDGIIFEDEQELCDYILGLEVVYKNFKQKILDLYKEE